MRKKCELLMNNISFAIASVYVDRLATETCYNTLDDAATQVANDICTNVEMDREQLQVIADLLVQHEDMDSETVKKHLSSFRQRGSLSAVGLLLPDNRLIKGSGEEDTFENVFDYHTELSRLPYISGIVSNSDKDGEKMIYQAVYDFDHSYTAWLFEEDPA